MKKLLVASNNQHKIKEIKEILRDIPVEILGLKEAGIDIDVEENGNTFMENAYIKAKAIYDLLDNKEDYLVMSDDSGLAVDALNGAPGVYSARFAGEHGNSKKNNEKLLSMLEGIEFEKRTARFICAIVLLYGEEQALKVVGEVEGYITDKEYGKDGFGYDPLFYTKEFNKTFAELTAEEKNSISHRGRALEQLKKGLEKLLGEN
ncbi:Non-canonical purine NTP pyrophosphatase [Clostridium sp. N3C]|uniref:XTP/dITP diphosphatase n=1 Tax=Clostridium sp. N3C TaxID=1776758 RepID=UPI00092E1423|nr:XTP/dITP diphosphatase [Clostridium sp. N3C]SCN22427.1 Non-canonical purine NTP pyrophosphatase [Clostridium sp. N3C]